MRREWWPYFSDTIHFMLIVMKFGGTSVGSSERMLGVAEIVGATQARNQPVVVVSAMSKVTDLLVAAAGEAQRRNREQVAAHVSRLREIHHQAVAELRLDALAGRSLSAHVDKRLNELDHLLSSISVLGELTPRGLDLITSFGERLSVHLVSAAFRRQGIAAEAVEATSLILTTQHYSSAMPLLDQSEVMTKTRLGPVLRKKTVPVVTGFIGATKDGILTTLGRGGSDYSATILGYALDADAVHIYTDVDGVMTADPRIVPTARTLPQLSYNEAAELSYFGAKILHPLTIAPAAKKRIPVFIKNTFNPAAPGTKIVGSAGSAKGAKAIITVGGVALITVQGRGMIGVPGMAAKVFGAIANEEVNVLFISQAASEYNISLVVHGHQAERAVQVLKQAFQLELTTGSLEDIRAETDLAIVAIVGEGMKGQPGVAARVFSALGKDAINVAAIAQGSSERNISFVIASADVVTAVNGIHTAFNLGQ
jgi:aspartokinase/homoserine dehydrogenase 1